MAYKFALGDQKLSGSLIPTDDERYDLGATGKEWNDLFIDGTANVDAINLNGTAVTATGTELNALASAGSNSAANKAIILDGNGDFEMQDSDKIHFGNGADANIHWDGNSLEIGADTNVNINIGGTTSEVTFGDNVTITGNLTVDGTTTTVNSTTINVTSSITFEGPADAFETTMRVGTPIQDVNIDMPNISASAGAHSVQMAVLATGASAADQLAASLVTAAEFKLLDGGTSVGNVALQDSDGFLHNDGGTMKQTEVVKIAELAFSKVAGDIAISSGGSATIQANTVEGSMLNDNVISGLTDIGAAITATDELMISDGGTLRRTDASRLKTYVKGYDIFQLSGSGDINGTIGSVSGSGYYYNAQMTSMDDNLNHEEVYFVSGSGWTVGTELVIKAPEFGTSGKISIYFQSASNGSHIHSVDNNRADHSGSNLAELSQEGAAPIVLESSFAAVNLILWSDNTEGGTTEYSWAIV